jgi:CcmD family protein
MSSNYVTMIVTLVIWIGVFFYLLKLDRKVKKLEKKMKLPQT